MAQYIDKSAVVAEIEKRMKENKKSNWQFDEFDEGYKSALEDILSLINTIENKDVDLEEEFADFLEKENAYIDDNNVISYYNGSSFNHTCDIYPLARHFFELGLGQKGE